MDGRAYGGGWLDWLTPFTLVCGLGTVAAYALMGACWLVWKLDGDLQTAMRRAAKIAYDRARGKR